MGNKISIMFLAENEKYIINVEEPDLAGLVNIIIEKHLDVSMDNIEIKKDEDCSFDTDEFKQLLVNVYSEFCEEVDKFFYNITQEIKTYYDDDALSLRIIEELKKEK